MKGSKLEATVGIDSSWHICSYPRALSMRICENGPNPQASPDDVALAFTRSPMANREPLVHLPPLTLATRAAPNLARWTRRDVRQKRAPWAHSSHGLTHWSPSPRDGRRAGLLRAELDALGPLRPTGPKGGLYQDDSRTPATAPQSGGRPHDSVGGPHCRVTLKATRVTATHLLARRLLREHRSD